MNRRKFLGSGTLGLLGALCAPRLSFGRTRLPSRSRAEPVEISTRATDLVLGSTVIDMLGLLTLDWDLLWTWHRDPIAFGLSDFLELRGSGVDVFHPAAELGRSDPYTAARRWLAGWNTFLAAEPCFVERVDSMSDLVHVARVGQIGVIPGLQDSTHFRSAADVELFHNLGQRVSQLTYNESNLLGSGCYEQTDPGLTDFGAQIVQEMNRVGMAIDVSHCGERTTLDTLASSTAPVLITHSNCRALVPWQPRCKSDEVIRRMAATGGVMGVTVVRAFVGAGTPSLAQLLDHFEHVARLVGPEHVGLGSDLDVSGIDPRTGLARESYVIRGLDPPVRVFQIADGLLRRGWTEADVALMLGGNFKRALSAIWGEASPVGPEPLRDPFCPAPAPPRPV